MTIHFDGEVSKVVGQWSREVDWPQERLRTCYVYFGVNGNIQMDGPFTPTELEQLAELNRRLIEWRTEHHA